MTLRARSNRLSAIGRAPEWKTWTGIPMPIVGRDEEIRERVRIPVDDRLGGCRGFKSHRPHHKPTYDKFTSGRICIPSQEGRIPAFHYTATYSCAEESTSIQS